uniref:Uncharacterized protein n=1 Tax=Arundo donax TaxID=35708 RepID=A0A0A9CFA4_ARUDO
MCHRQVDPTCHLPPLSFSSLSHPWFLRR